MGDIKVRGHDLILTEHLKLFVLEDLKEKTFLFKANSPVENSDIFTYVNLKFVYVERYFKRQINQIYYDLLKHKCELERMMLINALSTAAQAPDEFAFHLTKGKCRDTKECYNQLPVT